MLLARRLVLFIENAHHVAFFYILKKLLNTFEHSKGVR